MLYLQWLLTRVQLGSRFSIMMCHGLWEQGKEKHPINKHVGWLDPFDYCSIRKIKIIIIIQQCSQQSIFKIISLLNIKNKSPHTHQFLPIYESVGDAQSIISEGQGLCLYSGQVNKSLTCARLDCKVCRLGFGTAPIG